GVVATGSRGDFGDERLHPPAALVIVRPGRIPRSRLPRNHQGYWRGQKILEVDGQASSCRLLNLRTGRSRGRAGGEVRIAQGEPPHGDAGPSRQSFSKTLRRKVNVGGERGASQNQHGRSCVQRASQRVLPPTGWHGCSPVPQCNSSIKTPGASMMSMVIIPPGNTSLFVISRSAWECHMNV